MCLIATPLMHMYLYTCRHSKTYKEKLFQCMVTMFRLMGNARLKVALICPFLVECQVAHLTAHPLAPAVDLKRVASQKLAELQLAEDQLAEEHSDSDS